MGLCGLDRIDPQRIGRWSWIDGPLPSDDQPIVDTLRWVEPDLTTTDPFTEARRLNLPVLR